MNEQSRNLAQELNELVGPILEEVEKELNKWSFGQPVPEHTPAGYHIPTIVLLGNSTIVSQATDAFNLEPPCVGIIKDKPIKSREELGNVIVIRRIYSYSAACRLLESKDPKAVLPLIKEMVETLKRDRGFTPEKLNMGIYGTFKRPGTSSEYFREGENYAGFELRIYSATTLAENL